MSDELEYNVPLVTPILQDCVFQSSENRVCVIWSGVAYNDHYEIYQSVVALSQPAGDYTMIDDINHPTYYNITPHTGMREYYYIIGKNDDYSMQTDPSNVVFVDIPTV